MPNAQPPPQVKPHLMQPAGYSGTPLVKKLGFKAGFRVLISNDQPGFRKAIEPLPEGVEFVEAAAPGTLDMAVLFSKESEHFFAEFMRLMPLLKPNGMLWVGWPKKASKVPTNMTFEVVQPFGLDAGLVDVKVCAIDEVWTGLKFVYRLKDRKR